jgi:hypothetical protein
MKLIIIEGTDNTGKDTVISNIMKKYPCVKIYHCCKPKGHTLEECQQEQFDAFTALAMHNISDYNNSDIAATIHNRSWYGEFVYGCMYRDNTETWVKDMILREEELIRLGINEKDILLITLLANNADFLIKNDDGLSISEANKERIEEETKRFVEIHNFSTLKNKHIVWVNEGDHFRSREDIWKEINDFIDSINTSNE